MKTTNDSKVQLAKASWAMTCWIESDRYYFRSKLFKQYEWFAYFPTIFHLVMASACIVYTYTRKAEECWRMQQNFIEIVYRSWLSFRHPNNCSTLFAYPLMQWAKVRFDESPFVQLNDAVFCNQLWGRRTFNFVNWIMCIRRNVIYLSNKMIQSNGQSFYSSDFNGQNKS